MLWQGWHSALGWPVLYLLWLASVCPCNGLKVGWMWSYFMFVVWLPGKVWLSVICMMPLAFSLRDPLINLIIQLLNKTSRICSFLHCLTHCSAISITLCTVWSHWCPFPFAACFLHVETWTVFMSCFRLHTGACRTSVLIALMSWEGRRWNSNGR